MSLAQYIDHTSLKAATTLADIERLCLEAKEYGFASVCVPPYFVQTANTFLHGSKVKVATVIGFPFGYHQPSVKAAEAQQAIKDGADELDMVMNIAAFKSGDITTLSAEAEAVSRLTQDAGKLLKVIIESGGLTDEEIVQCCDLYSRLPIDFLKTSTGFGEGGASIEAIRLMRASLLPSIQIKASGGIRDAAFAQALINAGATRLGCSAGVAIVKGEAGHNSY